MECVWSLNWKHHCLRVRLRFVLYGRVFIVGCRVGRFPGWFVRGSIHWVAVQCHDDSTQSDESNVSIHDTPLPCLLSSFCKIRENEFIALAVRLRFYLEKKFTAKELDSLESDHREFYRGIRSEAVFKSIVGAQADAMPSDEGWGVGLSECFPLLCEFVGGLASAYAGTARIFADLSILGIEKNAFQTSLMNFSPHSSIYTEQFVELQALVTCLVYTSWGWHKWHILPLKVVIFRLFMPNVAIAIF